MSGLPVASALHRRLYSPFFFFFWNILWKKAAGVFYGDSLVRIETRIQRATRGNRL